MTVNDNVKGQPGEPGGEQDVTLYASKSPVKQQKFATKVTHEELQSMRNVVTDLIDCRMALAEVLEHARRAQINPEYAKDNCVCIEKLAVDCLVRTGQGGKRDE